MNEARQQRLVEFIRKTLLRDTKVAITAETLLFKEKILGSMNILELIGYIEKQMGRKLLEEEIIMSNFQSVKRISETFFHEERD